MTDDYPDPKSKYKCRQCGEPRLLPERAGPPYHVKMKCPLCNTLTWHDSVPWGVAHANDPSVCIPANGGGVHD